MNFHPFLHKITVKFINKIRLSRISNLTSQPANFFFNILELLSVNSKLEMAKSFLNIHFYAKNIKKIFKNGVKCKKSGNFGLLNQEFGFSKVYFIYSFYIIKNRSAPKSSLNQYFTLYLQSLNR